MNYIKLFLGLLFFVMLYFSLCIFMGFKEEWIGVGKPLLFFVLLSSLISIAIVSIFYFTLSSCTTIDFNN